jgi:hypothetical protein
MPEQSHFTSRDLAVISNQLTQLSDRVSWILNLLAVLALIVAVAAVMVLGGFVSIDVSVDAS